MKMIHKKKIKRCSKGIWDTTVPGIIFENDGSSNYSQMFENMTKAFPRGKKGENVWNSFVDKMKKDGKQQQYDCIIGVSGGTDSSYLMHIAKEIYGLRPLAVTFDNGWSSDISVKNIKKLTSALDIDLETYVVNYEEMKDVLKSYMKAGLPWIDFPTDHAIKSILYRVANREKIKHILIGHDFRTEGTQPTEWTYNDSKQLRYIQKRFGKKKLKTFPDISFFQHSFLSYIIGIKMVYPFFFLPYQKKEAQKLLIEKYDWEYYGGHHHENMFTKFAIAYWLPQKYNIDKRIITLSAQIMSKEISKEEALKQIETLPITEEEAKALRIYMIKKLEFTEQEFEEIWNRPNKLFFDYPSYRPMLLRIAKTVKPFIHLFLPQLPSFFFQLDAREDGNRRN